MTNGVSERGRVIVITGATGTGKTTVSDYLTKRFGIPQVITHTTRPPRPGETDGIDYYFESPESFQKNHYLESVTYAGNRYGSSYEGLDRGLAHSPLVSIVLDTAGAETYAKELGDRAIIIFLTVATPMELANRIESRGDNPEMIRQRLASPDFQRDLKLPEDLQPVAHVISNDNWAETKRRLDALVSRIYDKLMTS
ncbi:AAA family ATPase [Levilactobacillus bambusae]|uniref:Guanylate kinase n=1 Tax=Levilactobacillus bambusae TaxID=2024736 RepID=A0A2V1N0Y1_9LACO|nr:AAA family ATPase [Levilactobacillus bambusae]PWG00045.1 guanylate kinase [Levilactobacillus bambusae]